MTSERAKSDAAAPHPSNASLQGAEALDLYLAEIGRNIVAISAQSALLLSALKAQSGLLREISSTPAKPAARTDDEPV